MGGRVRAWACGREIGSVYNYFGQFATSWVTLQLCINWSALQLVGALYNSYYSFLYLTNSGLGHFTTGRHPTGEVGGPDLGHFATDKLRELAA